MNQKLKKNEVLDNLKFELQHGSEKNRFKENKQI